MEKKKEMRESSASAKSFTFHGSSKIIHQSVMKSRLDQKLENM